MIRLSIGCLLSILLFLSCSQEQDVVTDVNTSQTINEVEGLQHKNTRDVGELPINYDETLLQSVAFLFAKTYVKHPNIRSYFSGIFYENFHVSLDRINISELLQGTIAENPFLEAFREEYIHHYVNPLQSCSRPTEEEEPPTLETDLYLLRGEDSFSLYIDFILNTHCIELYFPNGIRNELLQVDYPNFISSAHPLTSATENYSYVNYDCVIEKSTVDSNTEGNIVIARFYRPQGNARTCEYPEYSFIEDFTAFLKN